MSKTDTELAEILDELGFASKPGSTKGRQYSSRFYHTELMKVLTAWRDRAVVGELRSQFIQAEAYAELQASMTDMLRGLQNRISQLTDKEQE